MFVLLSDCRWRYACMYMWLYMRILCMRLHKIHIYVLYGNIHKIWHQAKGGRGPYTGMRRAFQTDYHVWNSTRLGRWGTEEDIIYLQGNIKQHDTIIVTFQILVQNITKWNMCSILKINEKNETRKLIG